MAVIITDMEMPKRCGSCPFCIYTADEKRAIGYCNTSNDDYYCKALDRFMEYDKVEGGLDILGKPSDCPLKEVPSDEYKRGWTDAITLALKETTSYYTEDGVFKAIQEESLIGVGMMVEEQQGECT